METTAGKDRPDAARSSTPAPCPSFALIAKTPREEQPLSTAAVVSPNTRTRRRYHDTLPVWMAAKQLL